MFNTSNVVSLIEKHEMVSLTKIKKGVHTVLDFEIMKEKALQIGREEGMAQGMIEVVKNTIINLNLTNASIDEVIKKVAPLGCTEDIIMEAYKLVSKK